MEKGSDEIGLMRRQYALSSQREGAGEGGRREGRSQRGGCQRREESGAAEVVVARAGEIVSRVFHVAGGRMRVGRRGFGAGVG